MPGGQGLRFKGCGASTQVANLRGGVLFRYTVLHKDKYFSR